MRVALPASLSAGSFPFTLACPGQYTHRSFTGGYLNNGTIYEEFISLVFLLHHCIVSDISLFEHSLVEWRKILHVSWKSMQMMGYVPNEAVMPLYVFCQVSGVSILS